ncbi:MAG: helix-turn-helix transcriptional regulator [Clostridia bacterium]|nr:helix-turn-helix transcriptional regulator [Clostridia bacterium]
MIDKPIEVLSIGERIKKLRYEKGYTQQEIADKLQVSQATVAGWERGTSKPSVKVNNRLAELFGVTIEYLYRDWDDVLIINDTTIVKPYNELERWQDQFEDDVEEEVHSLVALYNSLNSEGKRRVRELMFDLRQIPRYQSATHRAQISEGES